MNQLLTDEQQELRTTLRRFTTHASPLSKVRSAITSETGFDANLWKRIGCELGLTGIVIPEAYGGAGFGLAELALITEELGRALVPSPYFASAVLAATMLVELGDAELNRVVLPGIATGETIASATLDGLFVADAPSIAARRDGDGWTLSGTAAVLDGMAADLLVVIADDAHGPCAFVVELDATGVTRTPLFGLDLTRSQARIDLDTVAARRVSCPDVATALRSARDQISVALAAELLGVMHRCVDSTVEYVKSRVQFGRSVGSFQAVKHGCAEMWVRYELAESAVRHAAALATETADDVSTAAVLALAYTSAATIETASDMIQFHGGIAYTWEHDAHLFYRRAHAAGCLLGRPAQHRARLADLLDI